MTAGPTVNSPLQTKRGDWLAFGGISLLTAWVYLSGVLLVGNFNSRTPPSYYGLLTEALLARQLHLKITPDPKLALLADPYAGPQGVNRPHDMSYYHGRFYLYYGVTPAAILFVPWKLLTGNYLNEFPGTVLFCLGGFLLSAWWLLGLKRRLFPLLAPGWLALALAVLAFGSPIFFLANNTTFYAVPISGAFFCLMAAVVAADRALLAQRAATQAAWLAAASLWMGLSVGARPTYVLSLPMLTIPMAVLWWRQKKGTRLRWPAMRLWFAAIVPAMLVGLLLAEYNYFRFDNPFDFGIQWSLGSGSQRGMRMLGPEFVEKNLRLYLTAAAEYIRYYPFLFTNNRPFGVLPHLPFVVIAALFPITWLRSALRRDHAWIASGSLLLGATLANFALLLLFFGGEDRYLVDFVPGLMLAAAATLLAFMSHESARYRVGRRLLGATLLALAAFTLGNGSFLALPARAGAPGRVWFERLADRPAQIWEKLAGTQHGPLELDVRFPAHLTGQVDPLLTTGNLRGTGDIVYVRYEDPEHARFGYFHVGAGGPISEPVKLDYTQPHHIVVRAGSLLPPPEHPMFSDLTSAQVDAERRRLEIMMDGEPVLRASVTSYTSTPDRVYVGENPVAMDVSNQRFRGKIISAIRQSWSPPLPDTLLATGPAALTVRFPAGHAGVSEPLIATGVPAAGDLFFVTYVGPDSVRFGHDNLGGGGRIVTRQVKVDLSRSHKLEVEMGSLYTANDPALRNYPAETVARLRQRFSVRLDGELVITTTRPFSPSTAGEVEFGFDPFANSMFTGTIDRIARPSPPAPAVAAEAWGPIQLSVKWPKGMSGVAEPLLETGRVGAADIVFVQYIDDRHVRFGLDHWSVGGPLSAPIEIDPTDPQTITMDLGSLYPPANHPAWRIRPAVNRAKRIDHVEVKYNGKTVLTSAIPAYPAATDEIDIGENYLGASTCRQSFSGQIIADERLPW